MSILGELFRIDDNDDWVRGAVCPTVDPEIFHPVQGNQGREAKKICLQCPVRAECLDWALRHRETGIWGGFSDTDRERLLQGQNPVRRRKPRTDLGIPRKKNGHPIACKCVVCRRAA